MFHMKELLKATVNHCTVHESDILSTESEGADDKYWILKNNQKYLMKDSSFNKRRKQPSYSPYCEHIASSFINYIGYNAHSTSLAIFENRHVVLCKNIFQEDEQFEPFKSLHQSSADTDLANKEYTYKDVLYVLSTIKNGNTTDLLHSFWSMFLIDAILGNRDRHEGNWGFYRKNNKVTFCTLFDLGASLYPDVDLNKWVTEDFIYERTYSIPASQFRMWRDGVTDIPMRTNFYEIILQCVESKNEIFLDEFEKIRSRRNQVLNFLNSFEDSLIPIEFLKFVKIIIYCRFHCLILLEDFSVTVKEAYNLFL